MIDKSRRAMLIAAMVACTASFAASPAYRPDTPRFVRPDSRAHRADIYSRARAPLPEMPVRHKDPFADMLLG
jgi:hypothetical protein